MTPRLTVWPRARQGLAAAALAAAVATSAGAALYADNSWTTVAALAHVVAAVWALADVRAVATQVGTGVAMAATALIEAEGAAIGAVVLVLGVVGTAELLAAADRLGMIVERDPGPELRRVGVAVAVAAVTAGLTLAAGALTGPPGLVAPAVATLGCLVFALALRAPGRPERQR